MRNTVSISTEVWALPVRVPASKIHWVVSIQTTIRHLSSPVISGKEVFSLSLMKIQENSCSTASDLLDK